MPWGAREARRDAGLEPTGGVVTVGVPLPQVRVLGRLGQ
jgi:hypothetical protein